MTDDSGSDAGEVLLPSSFSRMPPAFSPSVGGKDVSPPKK